MPSAAMAARSEASEITTLWPIAATGSWPVWRRVMVNSVHEEGTVIEPTLWRIASSPSIVVAQLLTTASPAASAGAAAADGSAEAAGSVAPAASVACVSAVAGSAGAVGERSEEHTSELQSRENLVCRLLLEKK